MAVARKKETGQKAGKGSPDGIPDERKKPARRGRTGTKSADGAASKGKKAATDRPPRKDASPGKVTKKPAAAKSTARTADAGKKTRPAKAAPAKEPAADPTLRQPGQWRPIWSAIRQWPGPALAGAALLAAAAAGAFFGPSPAEGALSWVAKGLLRFGYAVLLAQTAWLAIGRARGAPLQLWLGFACCAAAAWTVAAGIHDSRLRGEANMAIAAFQAGTADAADPGKRNPYVRAYMIMRDAHWELQDRLDARLSGYRAAYRSYVANGHFTDASRLQSRYELWRAYRQVAELEGQLAAMEERPLEFRDLRWTLDLLKVDRPTHEAYARDLDRAIETAKSEQAAFIAAEKEVLAAIGRSLKVVIDARGRYRFAGGRILFEDPAEAQRFAGADSPAE